VGAVPVLSSREVIYLLENLGFKEVRQRDSHKQFRHPDGYTTDGLTASAAAIDFVVLTIARAGLRISGQGILMRRLLDKNLITQTHAYLI
jgi:hypothetical protein